MRPALLAIFCLSLGLATGSHLDRILALAESFDTVPAARSESVAVSADAAARWDARTDRDIARREEVPCAQGGPVVLVLGQSNAANFVGERFRSRLGALNWFDGKCYIADGPMLGADGTSGSVWPLVGDGLIKAKIATSVTFVVLALGGTSSADWTDERGMGALLDRRLTQYKTAGLKITHAIWHQGESDFDTPPTLYRQRLERIFGRVRTAYPDVTFVVAQTSICGDKAHAQSRAEILQVQAALSGSAPGPNTDLINRYGDRYDTCHFSGQGARKLAAAWVKSLAKALH
jgi:hypothetical protein